MTSSLDKFTDDLLGLMDIDELREIIQKKYTELKAGIHKEDNAVSVFARAVERYLVLKGLEDTEIKKNNIFGGHSNVKIIGKLEFLRLEVVLSLVEKGNKKQMSGCRFYIVYNKKIISERDVSYVKGDGVRFITLLDNSITQTYLVLRHIKYIREFIDEMVKLLNQKHKNIYVSQDISNLKIDIKKNHKQRKPFFRIRFAPDDVVLKIEGELRFGETYPYGNIMKTISNYIATIKDKYSPKDGFILQEVLSEIWRMKGEIVKIVASTPYKTVEYDSREKKYLILLEGGMEIYTQNEPTETTPKSTLILDGDDILKVRIPVTKIISDGKHPKFIDGETDYFVFSCKFANYIPNSELLTEIDKMKSDTWGWIRRVKLVINFENNKMYLCREDKKYRCLEIDYLKILKINE